MSTWTILGVTPTTASQQPSHLAATSKHHAQGSNIPFGGNPSLWYGCRLRIAKSLKWLPETGCEINGIKIWMQKSVRNLIWDRSHLNKHDPLDLGIMYVVIFVKKSSIWASSKHPVVYVRTAGAFFLQKIRTRDFWTRILSMLVRFHQFEGPLTFFSKSGQSVQMAMPARRASTFCFRSWSQCQNLLIPDLASWWIPGVCEPWCECQPEGSGLRSAKSWN